MTTEQVHALLGKPGLRPLIDRVAQRIARGRPLTGPVVLAALGPAEQAAVASLLGRSIGTGSTASVRLEEVERVVRASGAAPDLRSAVEVLRGPIAVTADEAAREQERWDRVLAPLEAFESVAQEYAGLASIYRRSGVLKMLGRRGEEAEVLVRDLLAVLTALPTSGETRAAFSARVLQRAHALDVGPLRALVDTALARAAGDVDGHPELDRDDRFVAIWAAKGVAFDTLASSVLVHGLRFEVAEPVGAALDGLVMTGQPVLVTLRMLLEGARPSAQEVFVCENPAVLIAAADRFGAACPPMVCVRGQASAAAQRLLRLLADDGATLRYHGDFDWGGLRIANRLVERFGVVPWRYRTDDLRSATASGDALAGDPVEAVWDSALATAIQERGTRLEEEQVLEDLLGDLGRAASAGEGA